ncbi:helix-turn-helix domain-containing protein [Nocardioides campestrisoli]|uniref:helix-turn-helix domain-containing protein n=1 Tax=Nocardioides campestrisoli TaxID=2736757 RepID=UPI0015E6ED0A|nr:helix-turn-helix domain-containing protein [Nocardioides campestrisoli]
MSTVTAAVRGVVVAEEVYTIPEAAAIKKVSSDLIRRAIRATEGNTLAAKKVGKGYRIKASELDAWFDGLDDA